MAVIVQTPGAAPVSTCSPWAGADDLMDPCSADQLDGNLLSLCLQASSDVLFELSGHRWPGECSDTVRPGARSGGGEPPLLPGQWLGLAGGSYPAGGYVAGCGCNRSEQFGCGTVPQVALPGYPVTSVTEVLVDGKVLTDAAYRLDDERRLVRIDGDGWPCCQNLTLPATAVGTWQVAYTFGRKPPPAGKMACAALACQLALAFSPAAAGECKLPKRVTSVTRQGMTAVILDPYSFLEKGKTGVYEVDLFLASANPKGIMRSASVRRPEQGRSVRRTG